MSAKDDASNQEAGLLFNGEEVLIRVSDATPMRIDMKALFDEGITQGVFAEATLCRVGQRRPLGQVRVTLCASNATSANTMRAAAILTKEVWKVRARQTQGKEARIIPAEEKLQWSAWLEEVINSSETTQKPLLLIQHEVFSVLITAFADLRRQHRGVRLSLNLRTEGSSVGYCFIHILTTDPATAIEASAKLANELWLR